MYPPRIKTGAFVLEGLNSVSATFYFYFVYWYLSRELGFDSRDNLLWAVGHGFVYIFASLLGGRYGQRNGYLKAIMIGFAGMSACFLAGWAIDLAAFTRTTTITLQAVLMVVATVSICFTWPNLEAMVSEGEPGHRLQRYLGIYNLVWSGAGAVAYFVGGALIEAMGARTLVLLVPGLMIAGQLFIALRLQRSLPPAPTALSHEAHGPLGSDEERQRSPISPRTFLLMSWIANPCAYVAINAAVPLIPSLAERLGLAPGAAGVFCSIWLFSRTAAFIGLWRWNGWHYRFRWLAVAFVAMIAGFLFIFLSASFTQLPRPQILALASVAQILFGLGLGLIYYSSLFYSMDVGDTKGDHGGIHEAAIGAGIFGGPLVGAAAEFARPGSPTVAAWAVSGVLAVGLGALIYLRSRPALPLPPAPSPRT